MSPWEVQPVGATGHVKKDYSVVGNGDDRRRTDDGHQFCQLGQLKTVRNRCGNGLSQKKPKLFFALDCRSAAIQSVKTKRPSLSRRV